MTRKLILKAIAFLIFAPLCLSSQSLIYKFKSKTLVRKWTLSSKAYRLEEVLPGATVELFEGSKRLAQTTSDAEGNFGFDLPSSGNFLIVISKAGYNTRKFSVNCSSIIIKNGAADFIPSVNLTGFISDKTIKDVGDIGLSAPIVQMADDKNEILKYNGLNFPVNVNDGEIRVIQKFCTCNKLGDMAMQNKNYAIAKKYYQMASTIIVNEEYPKEQLKRAEDGLKEQMLAERVAYSNAKKKSNAAKPIVQKQNTSTSTSQNNTTQKSSSGGRKVLPVIGGKK